MVSLYLPPVPFTVKRNKINYTLLIPQKLSEIYNISVEEIAKITTKNSKAVFGI